jgi:hypothetical protein
LQNIADLINNPKKVRTEEDLKEWTNTQNLMKNKLNIC